MSNPLLTLVRTPFYLDKTICLYKNQGTNVGVYNFLRIYKKTSSPVDTDWSDKCDDDYVVIEDDNTNDIFHPIRGKTCNIKLLLNNTELESVLPIDSYSKFVQIVREVRSTLPPQTKVLFQGFMSCESYTQEYNLLRNSYTLTSLSVLESMKYIPMDLNMSVHYRRVRSVIGLCFLTMYKLSDQMEIGKIYFPVMGVDVLNKYIDINLLIDYEKYTNEFWIAYKEITNTPYSCLNKICDLMGWVLVEEGNDFYFLNAASYEGMMGYSLTDMLKPESVPISQIMCTQYNPLVPEIEDYIFTTEDHKRSINNKAKLVAIDASVKIDDFLLSEQGFYNGTDRTKGGASAGDLYTPSNVLTQFSYEALWGSDFYDKITINLDFSSSNGMYYCCRHYTKNAQGFVRANYVGTSSLETAFNNWGQARYTDTNDIYNLCTRAIIRQNTGTNPGNYVEKDVILIGGWRTCIDDVGDGSSQYSDYENRYLLKVRTLTKNIIKGGTLTFSMTEGMCTSLLGNSSVNASTNFMMALKVGNYFLHAIADYEPYFSTDFSVFIYSFRQDNGTISNTFNLKDANNNDIEVYDYVDLYIFNAYPIHYTSSDNYIEDFSIIENISLTYERESGSNITHNENKYLNIISSSIGGKEVRKSLELFTSLNNPDSKSILKDTDDGSVQTKTLSYGGVVGYEKPERVLLGRMSNYYSHKEEIIELDVKYDNNSKLFFIKERTKNKNYQVLSKTINLDSRTMRLMCFCIDNTSSESQIRDEEQNESGIIDTDM